MNFKRDEKAIIKDIKSKGMAFSDGLGKADEYVKSMVDILRGNENVIEYIACPPNLIKTLLLVTDSGKLVFAEVTESTTKGLIFEKKEYYYAPNLYDLSTLNEEETLIKTEKKKGLFGDTIDSLVLYFNGGSIALCLPKNTAKTVYDKILKIKKKFDKTKTQKIHVATKKEKSTDKGNGKDNGLEKMKELRKMYEDGILTKEEFLELLKTNL